MHITSITMHPSRKIEYIAHKCARLIPRRSLNFFTVNIEHIQYILVFLLLTLKAYLHFGIFKYILE